MLQTKVYGFNLYSHQIIQVVKRITNCCLCHHCLHLPLPSPHHLLLHSHRHHRHGSHDVVVSLQVVVVGLPVVLGLLQEVLGLQAVVVGLQVVVVGLQALVVK